MKILMLAFTAAKRQKRKEAKEKKKEMKMNKPNAQLEAELLKMWEIFRKETCEEDLRIKTITQAMTKLEGKVSQIIFKSAASRVIQSIAKHGNNDHRTQIFEELKGMQR